MKIPNTCSLGIDVGGTKIAAGLLAVPEGRMIASIVIPTRADRGGRAVLDDVIRLAREFSGQTTSFESRLGAIGIGICELVDCDGNLASSNCIDWLDQPVREELSTIAPVVIEADVRAAALAERFVGAGRQFRTFLYVTVGTGISCCLMSDGAPHLGARGLTGTMASSRLSIHCEQCGHVNESTLEDIASGPALLARFNAIGGAATTTPDVIAAAMAGDPGAESVVRSAAEALGSQIGLLVNVLDPEGVIIGGGLGLSEGPFPEITMASTRRHIWSEAARELPILRASTGADAGWVGAAVAAWQKFERHAAVADGL